MRILLCAATEMEISSTVLALSLKKGHTVQLLITGVGLLAATYALTKEVAVHRPDAILQAGVAGSLLPDLPLASAVAVRSECVGDLGVKEGDQFRSLFDLHLSGADTIPWQGRKLRNESSLLSVVEELPLVDGVTVNEISTANERINYYRNVLQVQVESMEGAALHYVALQEKIPFLQIRSLSNFIGERDKKKWQMKESIASLNSQLQRILTKLEAI
jgi:futalosine hydrolase